MNEMNRSGSYRTQEPVATAEPSVKRKKKKSGFVSFLGRVIRRFFLVLLTVIVLLVGAAWLMLNLIFNGPSPAARDFLTMSLLEPSGTKWMPGLFLDQEVIDKIKEGAKVEMKEEVTNTSQVVINMDGNLGGGGDEWEKYPDGIYFEDVQGKTFNAHVMVVRNPSQVYMATSSSKFSTSVPGKRITEMIELENGLAAVNAGAFFDNGTSNPEVGATPLGLVYSRGNCMWTSGAQPGLEGFAGFNEDNILICTKNNLTQAQAEELNIRDGCCFGPVLIINGEINMEAYSVSGLNPRTAIGQRGDGAVIFVCIDGRQPGSLGGTYADLIDIMLEYGAVNACNMDGGSSSVMLYRDTYGLYGNPGEVQMMNTYSVLQAEPRRMPTFWMVGPGRED